MGGRVELTSVQVLCLAAGRRLHHLARYDAVQGILGHLLTHRPHGPQAARPVGLALRDALRPRVSHRLPQVDADTTTRGDRAW